MSKALRNNRGLMIQFTRGVLTSGIIVNTSKLIPSKASKVWNVHAIRSFSDIQKCPSCGSMVNASLVLYKKALLGDPYSEVPKLAGECKAIKDDTFTKKTQCVVSKALRKVNEELNPHLQVNVEYYDEETTEIIMSAFLKRDDLEEGESDLTGDSGILALKMLSEKVAIFSGYVVDIGGQDQSFVRQFPNARKRIVMDINALAWALDKTPGVVYALGSADTVLEKSQFLSEEQRPETIFTMSNFFNVLSPEFSWRMLDATIARMKPGDRLVITNLYRDNFFEEKEGDRSKGEEESVKQVKSNYREGRSYLGVYEFNKAKTGEHYKSTIGDDFVSHVKHVHSDVELLQQKKSTRNCKVRADRTAPVKFITLEFIKMEPKRL